MSENIVPHTLGSTRSQKTTRSGLIVKFIRQLAPLLTVVIVLCIWQLIVSLHIYPPFIIPPPMAVLNKAVKVIGDGTLFYHAAMTFQNVVAGLSVGLTFAIILGYAIAKTPLLEDFLSPIIVAVQSAPVVAYAPLLIIWFGNGPTSKVVTGALIVFFPMLMNTIVGIRSVSVPLRDLMRSMRATPWQTFIKLEIPSAIPVLISGLKISATLAVIGAVVGEFISANAGLGFLVNLARNQYDTPLVLVAVLALTAIARLLYSLVVLIERSVVRWHYRGNRSA